MGPPFKPMGPPDKRRKMEPISKPTPIGPVVSNNDIGDPLWDDEMDDILMTQDNLNFIDNLTQQACTQQAVPQCAASVNNQEVGGKLDNNYNDLYNALLDDGDLMCPIMPIIDSSRLNSHNAASPERQNITSNGVTATLNRSTASLATTTTLSRSITRHGATVKLTNGSLIAADVQVSTESGIWPSESKMAEHAHVVAQYQQSKAELGKLRASQLAKDGEIKLLRDRLNSTQAELSHQKHDILLSREQSAAEKSRKEKELEIENQRLKSQLLFKDQEVLEIQNRLKKQIRPLTSADGVVSTPVRSSSQHPSNSQSATPVPDRYPTAESFHTRDRTPVRNSNVPSLKTSVIPCVEKGTQIGVSKTNHVKMRALTKHPKGILSGSQLSCKLLTMTSCTHNYLGNSESIADKHSTLSLSHRSESSQSSHSSWMSGGSSFINSGCNSTAAILLLSDIELEISKFLSETNKLHTPTPVVQTTSDLLACQYLGSSLVSSQMSECELIECERTLERCNKALIGLLCLVTHSQPVRQAILRVSHPNKTVPDYFNQPCSLSSIQDHNRIKTDFNPNLIRVLRENQVLEKLIQLTNTEESLGLVSKLCLDILTTLAQRCLVRHLVVKLVPVLHGNFLRNCLSYDGDHCGRLSLASSAISLLTALVRSVDVVHRLCTITDECLLMAVYAACDKGVNGEHLNILHSQSMKLLTTICGCHVEGCRIIMESNCLCSSKVISCLISILSTELSTYTEEVRTKRCRGHPEVTSDDNLESSSLNVLRQGAVLMHSLFVSDGTLFTSRYSENKAQFTVLVHSLIEIFKSLSPGLVRPIEITNLWVIAPACLSLSSEDTDVDMDSRETPEGS